MPRYLFVDYYDTIVKRNASLSFLKKKWAELLSEKINYCLDSNILFNYRISAENELYNSNSITLGEYSFKELNEKIFQRIETYSNISINFESFYNDSLLINEKVEIDSQYIVKKMFNYIKKMKEKGFIIYCVSDNEQSSSSYVKYMKKLDIHNLFDKIYVSSDYKLNKRSGELYDYILKKENIDPNNVLMIGDNKQADFLIPKQFGMKSKLIKTSYKPKLITDKKILQSSIEKNILNEIFKKDINYSNYAFSLFDFTKSLYELMIKSNQKKLVFLSREGQFLKKIFDIYQEDKEYKIETLYFYASRGSSFVPTLKNLSNENFDCLSKAYPTTNIENFLKSLSFNKNDIDYFLSKYTNEIQIDFYNSSVYKQIKEDVKFINNYNTIVNDQKENFEKYIEQLGISNDKIINLVDVGWKGTIQDNFYNFLKSKTKLNGFLLGHNQMGIANKDNKKFGILIDLTKDPRSRRTLIYNLYSHNFELILKANHGKTVKYDKINNEINPILQDDSDVYAYKSYIKILQEKIIDKYKLILQTYSSNIILKENINNLLCEYHLKMFSHQSFKNILWIEKVLNSHEQGFGDFGVYKSKISFKQLIKRFLKPRLIKLNLFKLK